MHGEQFLAISLACVVFARLVFYFIFTFYIITFYHNWDLILFILLPFTIIGLTRLW